jgi:hypothetical protein
VTGALSQVPPAQFGVQSFHDPMPVAPAVALPQLLQCRSCTIVFASAHVSTSVEGAVEPWLEQSKMVIELMWAWCQDNSPAPAEAMVNTKRIR